MCRKGKFHFIYKVLTVIIATCGLLLLPFSSFAQDLPCQDQDPTSSPCPLDSGVWVLVIVGAVFGTVYLHRKQKRRIRINQS
jgi:hypothetical protein